MLDKNSESHVHVEAIEEPSAGKEHRLRAGEMGLIAIKAPVLSCHYSGSR